MRPNPDLKNLTIDALNNFQFGDIFNLADIQRLQDLFADAHGVASIVTHVNGKPITNPSNFTRLCNDIIRKTEKGCANCFKSDAAIGKQNSSGPIVQPCLSGGLWDAGASITVGGKQIANWLIGQVRNEELDRQRMIEYADEIGVNRAEFLEALNEVPVMSVEKFNKVAKMLFAFANELSEKAYSNLQLRIQISESKQAELLLIEKNKQNESQKEKHIQINKELAFQNQEKEKRAAALIIANKELVFQNEEKEKRAAELIIANEHAQESDNLKTAFLNNISHEIRTPFNGILGFLSLLQEEEVTESEKNEYINIINKSAFRLMNTINDLVEISQIQAGQIQLTYSETNIRKLISGVYNHFKTDAENKGLKFYIDNKLPNTLENIYIDNLKLNSILTILVGNAIKFTQTGSIVFGICLVDKVDDCTVETHGRAPLQLHFSVEDSGIGIPDDKQLSIFEIFMQADGSNTRIFEGSGLGLSIVKAYVEMLGGRIGVKSEIGKGAKFYFTVPFITEPEVVGDLKNIAVSNVPENQAVNLKILIAEDDEESTILLERAVRIFAREIIKVRTSQAAIESCRSNPDLDLILMDIKMPGIDGWEATRQIRQFNPDVVIIAETAYAMKGDREKSLEVGCNDYISKPINKDLLIEMVRKHFKKY